MAAAFLTQVVIALLIFLLLLAIGGRRIRCQRALLAVFFAVYFADNLLIVLANRFSHLQIIPNHVWGGFLVCSWSGKLYSVIFAIALLFFCRKLLTKNDLGLVFRQTPGSLMPAFLVVLALAAWALVIGLVSPKGRLDLQALLYLALMPGLNEELVYRGYLMGALDKILPVRRVLLAAPLGWGALVTSLLFGLLHGFWLDRDLVLHVEWIALQNSAFSGLVFAWLRARTGSLLVPVIAHGMEDFLFFLPRML